MMSSTSQTGVTTTFAYRGEAGVKGDEKARRGYAFMYGNADDWDVIRDCHEKSMREAMSEILAAREAERAEREAKGEPAPSRRTDPPPSKADPGLAMPRRQIESVAFMQDVR